MKFTRTATVRKVIVNLTSDEVEFLEMQAETDGVTFTDVLRRSIHFEKFFVEQQQQHHKLFVREPGRPLREVIRKKQRSRVTVTRRGAVV